MSLIQLSTQNQEHAITHMFIAAGEMEAAKTLSSCALIFGIQIIAVDGGLYHCFEHKITPHYVIGDLDSVSRSHLTGLNICKIHDRVSKTDLEFAVAHAKIDKNARAIIFGGLGSRADHSINNLYLLAKYPLKLTCETGEETIFAITEGCGEVTISTKKQAHLSLIPFYSYSGPSSLTYSKNKVTTHTLEQGSLTITCESGCMLCIVSDKKLSSQYAFQNFLPSLFDAAINGTTVFYDDDEIFTLSGERNDVELLGKPGQMISILPLMSRAEGVKINGLSHNVGAGYSEFNAHFLSLSNTFVNETATIDVTSGYIMIFMKRDDESTYDQQAASLEL